MIRFVYEKGSFYHADHWHQFEPRFFSPRYIREIQFREVFWHAVDGEETIAHRFRRHVRQGVGTTLEQYVLLTTHCYLCLHSDGIYHICLRWEPASALFRPIVLMPEESMYIERLVAMKKNTENPQYLNKDLFVRSAING